MNRVELVGQIVSDLELHENKLYAACNLRVPRDEKDANGKMKFDTFPIVFGSSKFAFAKQFVKKGHKMAVFGRLCMWEDKLTVVVEADSTDWLKEVNTIKEDN